MRYEAFREISEEIRLFLEACGASAQIRQIRDLWILCAVDDFEELMGICAYSYIDGRTNAELKYIYLAEEYQDYGEGHSLLLESFKRLGNAGVVNVRAHVLPERLEREKDFERFLISVGFGAISLEGAYITCLMEQIKESQIIAVLQEHPEYLQGVNLLEKNDSETKAVRWALWEKGLLRTVCREEDVGLSRYYSNRNKLQGVLLARRDQEHRVEIEDYYDFEGNCRLAVFRRILLGQINSLLEVFPKVRSIGINCQNEELAMFVRRCFGKIECEEKLQIWEVNILQ